MDAAGTLVRRSTTMTPPTVRPIDAVNWIGLYWLVRREVRRFFTVWLQTVLSPVVATLLFLAIFVVVLGERDLAVPGAGYLEFVAPGMVLMTMLQNAFANTSSSILIAKVSGTITDVLVAPLTAVELTVGYALGAWMRGLLTGALVAAALVPFGALTPIWPGPIIAHAVLATLAFALLGIIAGIFAERMEHVAALSSLVITPLTVLSGVFFAAAHLPAEFRFAVEFNPVFYLVDGFRQGFVPFAETDPAVGLAVVVGLDIGLFWICRRLFASGYRLKP
jgi:ABC-2 type transport system permease protein